MSSLASQIVQKRLDQQRLSRMSGFTVVAALAWLFFAVCDCVGGYLMTAAICLAGFVGNATSFGLVWKGLLKSRAITTHSILGVNLVCICVLTLFTGVDESYSPLFFCCFGIFAWHMLGIRASFVWSMVCVVTLMLIYVGSGIGEFPALQQHTTLDKTFHCIGMILVLLFINYRAQQFSDYQTDSLVSLTESLEEKASAFERLAQYDVLTQLNNRHSFEEHIQSAIANAEKSQSRLGVLMLDLNGFKQINDVEGHSAGDELLKSLAGRLKQFVPSNSFVARIGGDEFVVILEDIADQAEAVDFATALSSNLSEFYQMDDQKFEVGVSIGVAVYPDHALSAGSLLAFSDTAMYESKAAELTDVVLYHPSMTQRLFQRREIESQLKLALPKNEFELFYQPQLDVTENRVVGMEALLRWNKDGNWISPKEFIGSLESTREIRVVGRWVLMQACLQARRWQRMGLDMAVSVNMSAIQFLDPSILDQVFEALETSGLDPARLDIEITESILIQDIDMTSKRLQQLRELGVAVSIDDFGTGYSSLSYLRDLPLTRLKIDRTFIKGIPSEDEGVIAKAIIDLSHNLNLKVLAEGVEKQEQLDFLRLNSCDQYQGFLFSRPVPVRHCDELLRQSFVSTIADVAVS